MACGCGAVVVVCGYAYVWVFGCVGVGVVCGGVCGCGLS